MPAITLTKLRNFLSPLGRKNFFIGSLIIILGVLGFNLWFLLGDFGQSSQRVERAVLKNFSQPDKTFGDILSESLKTAAPTPQVAGVQISGKVSIALLGDSMIETLGDLKNLALSLQQYYPSVEFSLLNYGAGATKPEDGFKRLTQPTNTTTKQLPPLLSQKPDIVIVESYSYNHGQNTPEAINSHYQKIAAIMTKLKQANVTPLFLVTIAPSENFAKGAPGILWDENRQKLEAQTVIAYLQAALKFAQDQKLTFVNAFSPSLDSAGSLGKPIYVNTSDNIHPSPEGIELVSDLVAQKIAESKLVEKILDQNSP